MSTNVQWQSFKLTEADRANIKNQQPQCLWMTGLSGAGKSTLASALEEKLNQLGKHTYILDSDNLRHGLIQKQQPILGVIGVPAKIVVYAAVKGEGAFKQQGDNELQSIQVRPQDPDHLTFAVSRSHLDNHTKELDQEYGAEILPAGSALKLAYVAEGVVDVYPRFGPTMLWDAAAGQCIIQEAGGQVLRAHNQQTMTYNINHMKNDSFIALNKKLKNRVVA
jgi:3'-phosphoadenosine 5'-phosphosulfate (PAPS) 3'-phosphatase